ncbi:prolyl-tRNA synthetase associated domain-containing protein [Devosia sp. SL43]|uniref:prolyl-tRNA synthetase associated domain-containing protein n=1 Tax=Devosia sp. SL43 TaxID=2806348 RepID=UPI001F2169A9|nr:prolyl-tRNA synthetase associated domain-containing protein [Devosia sp. SL43]UJW86419.1 prolyl-tRNA synthetase associated domain-containing protein [Devosia sp. SL43]
MTDARAAIDTLFAELAITPISIEHPPVHTVEEALPFWSALEGVHTKNLLLKGAKGGLWLVCVPTDRRLDLKSLAAHVGAKKFSFASGETLLEALGVVQGSVSPLALINDKANAVQLVLAKDMMAKPRITVHPLTNTATVSLTSDELLRVVAATGHRADIVDFDAIAAA